MNTLIIGDIHLKQENAEKIISKVPHDQVIFVGDFFDDFNDTPAMVTETADWLNWSVNQPNRVHLIGNHDIHYQLPYKICRCSGYDQWKQFIISDLVDTSTWNKLKWYEILDDTWLISHAGLTKALIPTDCYPTEFVRAEFLKNIANFIDNELVAAHRQLANNKSAQIIGAGRGRGGSHPTGGIIWCDFNSEFRPVKGLNQIVGHTPQAIGARWRVRDNKGTCQDYSGDFHTPTEENIKNTEFSHNVCIDVNRNLNYAVWDGKTLKIGGYKSIQ